MLRTVQELVNAYYDGWKNGSWKKGQIDVELFHPGHFRFSGAVDRFNNREEFASALVEKVGRHLDFGKVLRQFADGNDVCTIYDFKAGGSLAPAAEWIHAENGYITEINLIFDPTKLLPGMGPGSGKSTDR